MGGVGLVYVEKGLPVTLKHMVTVAAAANATLGSEVNTLAKEHAFAEWPADVVASLASAANVTVAHVERAAAGDATFQVTDSTAGWVIAISAFFFVFNFAYGFGPIVWVYCAEIFPARARARCVGVCTLANWVGNFIIAQFTPMMLSSIQFSTFLVFGFFCLISVFLAAWLPETKGVPLELIQVLFDKKSGFKSTASARTLTAAADDGSSESESDSDTNE
eukprot:SRR837773.21301.p3 GENE.SRR837773.21301~~SRR837773.21301.p3  ORF type:complete len:254 (-),score=93.32 SRR837773.21301:5-664(-)